LGRAKPLSTWGWACRASAAARHFSFASTFTAGSHVVERRLAIHDKTSLVYEDDDGNLFYGAELVGYDDVMVEGIAPVPEPRSILALLNGLTGLVAVRRRR